MFCAFPVVNDYWSMIPADVPEPPANDIYDDWYKWGIIIKKAIQKTNVFRLGEAIEDFPYYGSLYYDDGQWIMDVDFGNFKVNLNTKNKTVKRERL